MFWMTREDPRGKISWFFSWKNHFRKNTDVNNALFLDSTIDKVFAHTSLRQFLLDPLNPITCFWISCGVTCLQCFLDKTQWRNKPFQELCKQTRPFFDDNDPPAQCPLPPQPLEEGCSSDNLAFLSENILYVIIFYHQRYITTIPKYEWHLCRWQRIVVWAVHQDIPKNIDHTEEQTSCIHLWSFCITKKLYLLYSKTWRASGRE